MTTDILVKCDLSGVKADSPKMPSVCDIEHLLAVTGHIHGQSISMVYPAYLPTLDVKCSVTLFVANTKNGCIPYDRHRTKSPSGVAERLKRGELRSLRFPDELASGRTDTIDLARGVAKNQYPGRDCRLLGEHYIVGFKCPQLATFSTYC